MGIKLLRRCRELRAENDKLRRENEEYQAKVCELNRACEILRSDNGNFLREVCEIYNAFGSRIFAAARTTPLNAYEWANTDGRKTPTETEG